MEHQKTLNLLNKVSDSKLVTRNWNIVNGQSNVNESEGNEIIYSTEASKCDLLDYNEVNILVRGNITIVGNIAA